MSANDDLADALISRAIALSRYGAGVSKDVLKQLVEMQKTILRLLPLVTDEVNLRKQAAQIAEIQKIIDDTYKSVADTHQAEMTDLVIAEQASFVKSVNAAITVELAKSTIAKERAAEIAKNALIVGNPAEDWWKQQSKQTQDEFKRVVRLGLSNTETNEQISKRVREAIGVSKRNADSLVRTSTQAVAINARDASAQANAKLFSGKQSLAVLDSRTTLLCASYDHALYTLDNKPLPPKKLPYLSCPRHFRCRSMFTFVLKDWKEIGLDKNDITEGMRSSIDGLVSAKVDFNQFLAGKSKEWQKAYLGEGRYELYSKGKITLSDLIDGNGRELTLKELTKFE